MSLHVLQLKQSSTVLVNWTDTTDFGLISYGIRARGTAFTTSPLKFTIRGSSVDDLFDNAIALVRALRAARENLNCLKAGLPYTPIWLIFQESAATNAVQSECFGLAPGDEINIDNLLNDAILGKRIPDISINLYHRGYFEEAAAVALAGSPFTSANNGALLDIAAADVRGDLPAPLTLTVRAGAATYDRVIAAVRGPAAGTVANYVCLVEAEGYTDKDAACANLADATFSPGGAGTTGIRWTPANTTETMLLRWAITTNVIDRLGPVRVLAAVKDAHAATVNVKIRVKAFTYSGTTRVYGEWGATQKFAAGVGARQLVDCGIVHFPGADSVGIAPTGIGLELWGQALASGAGHELDMDCLYWLPVGGGDGSGYASISLPLAMGNGAQPDGVIDACERVPQGRLIDGSANLVFPASDLRGKPIYLVPNRAAKLIVLVAVAATGASAFSFNNTVTATVTPRYTLARGT